MKTPITDSKTDKADRFVRDCDVVKAEWARELEIDVKILFYRLLCEPEDSYSPETLDVMRKWADRLVNVMAMPPYLLKKEREA